MHNPPLQPVYVLMFHPCSVCMLQEDVVSETAQMSWGDFKPRLADAVGSSASLHSPTLTVDFLKSSGILENTWMGRPF